jgi:O-antigen ligase
LVFAERYVYWVTGWRIFNDHPLLGVGLGNAGLYFLKYLPSYGWVLAEVMESIYRLPAIMNIKSFWVRILAETGLAGFATFASWYAILWQTSRFLEANKQKLMSMLGLAGQLVLVAFIAEGFSIDTFALPYLWLALGFISAAGMLARREAAVPPQAGTLPGR